jgi:hypothetical protein
MSATLTHNSCVSTPRAHRRYAQHTSKCAQCSAALARIRGARAALQWAAGLAVSLALVTAAVAAVAAAAAAAAAASPPGLSAAAAGDGGGGGGGVVAAALQQVAGVTGRLLAAATGAAAPSVTTAAAAAAAAAGGAGAAARVSSGVVARLLVWLAVAGVCWGGRAWLGRWEGLLLHGDYPPPRNLDRS